MPEKFIPQEALSPARVKPGSFTHSTDYIHILRRNHLAEEINTKGAAANPQHSLASVAPRAWEKHSISGWDVSSKGSLSLSRSGTILSSLCLLLLCVRGLLNRTEFLYVGFVRSSISGHSGDSRVCFMGLSRDSDLSHFARLK